MTTERVGQLETLLRAAIERGVEVWVITKILLERGRDHQHHEDLERGFRDSGVQRLPQLSEVWPPAGRYSTRCQNRQHLRVQMRVQARLHTLQFASVRCSQDSPELQHVSLSRSSSQLARPDF